MRAALALLALLGLAAPCGAQDTVPAGYGSLRRDDIAIRFRTGQVEVQLLPLDEHVIRLLAPDTYESLAALVHSRRTVLAEEARRAGVLRPALFMVTFFGLVPQARFTPDDLNITSRGRLFRPVGIVPLSPSWAGNQIDARQQAMALYLFEDGIGLAEHLIVSYQGMTNDSWSRAVSLLERERARVVARAKP
jgi:hypothetical protein